MGTASGERIFAEIQGMREGRGDGNGGGVLASCLGAEIKRKKAVGVIPVAAGERNFGGQSGMLVVGRMMKSLPGGWLITVSGWVGSGANWAGASRAMFVGIRGIEGRRGGGGQSQHEF